ncbi:hypothetical protein [Pantoea sp. CCBC3-3-1]|uniref:hypothetical protein n=1 Tax=Pantoea sp. CCBC3-3-1 TaxID=2490851 RepID=UPI001C2BA06E
MGWRTCFGLVSALALLLMAWVCFKLPGFAGQAAGKRLYLGYIFTLTGVKPVLSVVLAHNILYTYIALFLAKAGWPDERIWC